MNSDAAIEPGTALLALLAYQQMSMVESVLRADSDDLAERLAVARMAADALVRSTRLCDAIPGGQNGAVVAMEPMVSPVDEFWLMTRPRIPVELWLRAAAVAALEIELLQRVAPHLGVVATEVVAAEAGAWRAIDHGGRAVAQAIASGQASVDELSLYARRLLGESAVMTQRLVVRQPGLRRALTGTTDEDLTASSALLDDLLGALGERLRSMGLSV